MAVQTVETNIPTTQGVVKILMAKRAAAIIAQLAAQRRKKVSELLDAEMGLASTKKIANQMIAINQRLAGYRIETRVQLNYKDGRSVKPTTYASLKHWLKVNPEAHEILSVSLAVGDYKPMKKRKLKVQGPSRSGRTRGFNPAQPNV